MPIGIYPRTRAGETRRIAAIRKTFARSDLRREISRITQSSWSLERKRQAKLRMGERHKSDRKFHAKAILGLKRGAASKGYPKSAAWRRKLSESSRANWSSLSSEQKSKRVRDLFKGPIAKPNRAELKLEGLLEKFFPREFKINVRKGLVIGGKIPDFVNVNGKKVLVELFGRYWHDPKEEASRKKTFSKWGFKTIVVWEEELKNPDLVIRKVREVLQ